MPYSAVIFDLDGTLLDTLEDLADATNHVLEEEGFPTHPVDSYRHFVGDGARMLVTRALPEARRQRQVVERLVEAFRMEYWRRWDQKTKPFAGVAEMLDALVSRGAKKAVLSNKPHEFTLKCVQKLLGNWTFDAVLGQQEGIPRKPDPAAALKIARQLDLTPSDFVFLGDSAVDIKTAIAAGMLPVGVRWGFRSPEELIAVGAALVINRPMQILDFLA